MREEKTDSPDEVLITVYRADHEWTASSNPDLKRWRLIIGKGVASDDLSWAYTYNPVLAELGTHFIEFYRDTSSRNCIRLRRGNKS